jgi:hypothetical protein
MDVGSFCKLEQLFKLRFLNVINWRIGVGNFYNLKHFNKLRFLNVINWLKHVSHFYKFKFFFKSKYLSAFNWPIDLGNSFILTHIDILRPWFKIS